MIKSAGGLLTPASDMEADKLTKFKSGELYEIDIKLTRKPSFHRKVFSFFNFCFAHWKGENEFQSPIIKFLGDDLTNEIVKEMGAKTGDIIFFGADKLKVVRDSLGELRNELARKLDLIDNEVLAFGFIVDFPLFEEDKKEGNFAPEHHMFTRPKDEDLELLEKDPSKVRSYQYDLVCNGYDQLWFLKILYTI
jgi:aspartyl-tRNA synthetase